FETDRQVPTDPRLTLYGSLCEKSLQGPLEKNLVESSSVLFMKELAPSQEIHQLLQGSSHIYFSGFGYHNANMDYLMFDQLNPANKTIRGDGYQLDSKTRCKWKKTIIIEE